MQMILRVRQFSLFIGKLIEKSLFGNNVAATSICLLIGRLFFPVILYRMEEGVMMLSCGHHRSEGMIAYADDEEGVRCMGDESCNL